MSEKLCKLRITRPSGSLPLLTQYTILINRMRAGKIAAGGVLDLEVPPGSNLFEAVIFGAGGHPCEFVASPWQPVELEVTSDTSALSYAQLGVTGVPNLIVRQLA